MDAMGREAASLSDDIDPAIEAFLIAGCRRPRNWSGSGS